MFEKMLTQIKDNYIVVGVVVAAVGAAIYYLVKNKKLPNY